MLLGSMRMIIEVKNFGFVMTLLTCVVIRWVFIDKGRDTGRSTKREILNILKMLMDMYWLCETKKISELCLGMNVGKIFECSLGLEVIQKSTLDWKDLLNRDYYLILI